MKVLIVLLLGLTFVLADHDHGHHHGHESYVVKTHDDLVTYRSYCAEKVHASEELVEKYKKWQYPDDAVTHCYLECVFQKFGFYDPEHGFDVHKIHVQLAGAGGKVSHSDEMHQKIANCADSHSKEGDSCSKAYHAGMCFMNANLQLVQHSVQV
ncbi:general odorant-binding protein 99b [Drosophila eugracilis]|uniref:general odorant-binding protein 99b n=1 Tax=Drosophila eugracilis TaxID=29029 RepID=UPI0007E884CD|nr:general odorant-binding protein 99b [Drosophila eugracilis]